MQVKVELNPAQNDDMYMMGEKIAKFVFYE